MFGFLMLLPFWSEARSASANARAQVIDSKTDAPIRQEEPKRPSAEAKNETEPTYTVSRDEVGRATWTLLHSIASYYPDTPTRQQQKDVKNFVDCLSRLYPCEICAQHFQQIVKENPVRCHSSQALQEWTCDVHNTVNRSLKKPTFNCSFLQARWGAVDCGTNGSCRVHYRDAQQALRNAR